MKRLILALALIFTINPAFAVDANFVFYPPVNEGDRPRLIEGHGNPYVPEQAYPQGSLTLNGSLDPASDHEYDYRLQDGVVIYDPQKQPGPQ